MKIARIFLVGIVIIALGALVAYAEADKTKEQRSEQKQEQFENHGQARSDEIHEINEMRKDANDGRLTALKDDLEAKHLEQEIDRLEKKEEHSQRPDQASGVSNEAGARGEDRADVFREFERIE